MSHTCLIHWLLQESVRYRLRDDEEQKRQARAPLVCSGPVSPPPPSGCFLGSWLSDQFRLRPETDLFRLWRRTIKPSIGLFCGHNLIGRIVLQLMYFNNRRDRQWPDETKKLSYRLAFGMLRIGRIWSRSSSLGCLAPGAISWHLPPPVLFPRDSESVRAQRAWCGI